MAIEVYSIDDLLKVRVQSEFQTTPEMESEINKIWNLEKQTRPNIFDGMCLSVKNFQGNSLECELIPYRYILAQSRDTRIKTQLQTHSLAVSGAVLYSEAIVVGKRASSVTQYPGFWELVPSGGIDGSRVAADGSVDFKGQLLVELYEELQLPAEVVKKILPISLILDVEQLVYDICLLISVSQVSSFQVSNEEYDTLELVPLKDLSHFLKSSTKIVPTSQRLADIVLSLPLCL